MAKTIDNIFDTAKYPERVFVGGINQDDEDFVYDGPFKDNVQIETITPEQSEGYGKCRKMAQDKFFNHDYYLQIAPHSRLLQDWDEKFINYYNMVDGKHIIVSTPSSYDIDTDKKEFLFFIDGIIEFHDHAIFHYNPAKTLDFDKNGMRKTLTFFAGCIFTAKDWVKEVGYDDNIFLYGEEPDLNLRTFGAGYTAWLIKEEIVWHLWGRKNRKALGHIREKDLYNARNLKSKKYIVEKLLNKGYKKQDEFFKLTGLTYENLQEISNKLNGVKNMSNTIKAVAKYNRNYNSLFVTKEDQEYDVPSEIFNKYPNHFIVRMVAEKPVVAEKPAVAEKPKPAVKTKAKKSK